jgi:hypothetical protein
MPTSLSWAIPLQHSGGCPGPIWEFWEYHAQMLAQFPEQVQAALTRVLPLDY